MSVTLPRGLGFWSGCAIMVGIMIGGGIFQAPTAIAREMGHPGLILLFWLIGGLVSLFGALAYAELSATFPQSGGIYVFLREGYGPGVAFVFGWTYLLITKPLGAGGVAIVFATHLNELLGTHWHPPLITSVALIALTIVNTFPVRIGGGFAVVLTTAKFAALLAIALFGLLLIPGAAENFQAGPPPRALGLALVPVFATILWTYDGWSDIGAIAGEVRNPQRNLPRIFLTGSLAVIAIYLAVNIVFLWIIPLDRLRTMETVAPFVMHQLLGDVGRTGVTLLILVSVLGSTHGSIITGARVSFAQAQDGLLFRALTHVHPRYGTPDASLWFQLVLSCLAVYGLGTFEALISGFVFTMWIFYALAVTAVIVLRIRRPELPRPYRCWGYPYVPILFVLAALGMTGLAIAESPRTTLPWLLVLAGGWPVYLLWRRVTGSAG